MKPYSKRQMNDAADAAAFWEAVQRPSIRPRSSRPCPFGFAPPSEVREALAGLVTKVGGVHRVLWHREFHRRSRAGAVSVRARLVSRRTATINQIRPFLIEHGIAVRTGANSWRRSHFAILENRADELSPRMTSSLASTRTGCGIVLFSGDGDFPSLVSALQEKTGLIADIERRVAKVPDALTNKVS